MTEPALPTSITRSVRPLSPFIVMEGLDGAGTTTQSERLAVWLEARGHTVHRTREPSDNPIGSLTRTLLSTTTGPTDASAVALLFAADRLDHVAREVEPARKRGCWVISDRYLLSSLAYQAQDPNDLDWIRAINSRAVMPELTIFVRVPVDVCLSRLSTRTSRDIYERRDVLERVNAAYERLVVNWDRRHSLAVVDGTLSVEAVHDAVVLAVSKEFQLTS